MQTRSQTRKCLPEIVANVTISGTMDYIPLEIDFDEASRLWNANKKKISNGCYQYVCGIPLENETFCKRKICKTGQYCSIHKTI
jgi:hypothetical protein